MPAFIRAKYESDNGDIHPIRLSPQVYDVVSGTEPDGIVTSTVHAKQSKNDREYGLRARFIRIARAVGAPPDTYNQYAILPILRLQDFEAQDMNVNNTISYKGVTWTIVSTTKESKK